jgi:hypothetical protein
MLKKSKRILGLIMAFFMGFSAMTGLQMTQILAADVGN